MRYESFAETELREEKQLRMKFQEDNLELLKKVDALTLSLYKSESALESLRRDRLEDKLESTGFPYDVVISPGVISA